MSEFESRIIEKLEVLDTRLDCIDKTLVKQESNLSEHMRRTDLLEKKIDPIEQHVHQLKGIAKFIGFLISLSAVALALYEAFKK